ncbi:hypothetical protein E3E23_03130 [Thermococcus sp. CX2]|uniref:hypothetical protein n=1 Tax=Thermococcus sp. CX2 TaxID=163006 RepID=UPI0014388EB4|nr:hypothetical protein [Thermococcus sp. CX2]NJE84829.1 hypothetical protein [Thermococcus sp. CX2]
MEGNFEKSFELFTLIDDTFRNVLIGILGIILAILAVEPSPLEVTGSILSILPTPYWASLMLISLTPLILMASGVYGWVYARLLERSGKSFLKLLNVLVDFRNFIKALITGGLLLVLSAMAVRLLDDGTLLLFYSYILVIVEVNLFAFFIYFMYRLFVEVSETHLILPRERPEEMEHVVNLSQSLRKVRRLSNETFIVSGLIITLLVSMGIAFSSITQLGGSVGSVDWWYVPLALVLWLPLGLFAAFFMKSYELGVESLGNHLLDDYDIVIFLTGFEYGDIPRSFSLISAIEKVLRKFKPKEIPKNTYFRSLSTDRVAAMIAGVGLAGKVPYPDSEIYGVGKSDDGRLVIVESYDSLGGIMNLIPPLLLPEEAAKKGLTSVSGSPVPILGTFPYALKLAIEVKEGNVDLEGIFKEVFGSGQVGYSPTILAHVLEEVRQSLGVEKLKVDVRFEVSTDAIREAVNHKEELVGIIVDFINDLRESGLSEALFYSVCHPDFCERDNEDPHVVLHILGYNEELPEGAVEYPLPLLVPIISVRALEKILELYAQKNPPHGKKLKIAVVALGSIQSNPVIHYVIAHNRWVGRARGIYDLSNPFDCEEFRMKRYRQGLTVKSVGPLQFSVSGYDPKVRKIVTGFACGRETENNCFLVGMVPFSFLYFPYSPLHKVVLRARDALKARGLEPREVSVDFWTLSGAGHPGAISTIIGAMILPGLLKSLEGAVMRTELLDDDDPTFYIVSFPIDKTLRLLSKDGKGTAPCPNLGSINSCYTVFEEMVKALESEEVKSLKVVGMRVD